MSQNTNYNLEDNYALYGLYKQNWGATYLIDQRTAIITYLSDMMSKPMYTTEVDGKYHYGTVGNIGVVATIATRAANPNNPAYLDLTFTDTSFNDIRVHEQWASGSTTGRVVSHTPGKATISPWNVSSFASTDFAAGNPMAFIDVIAPSIGSGATENRFYIPTSRTGYVGVMREDRTLGRRELKYNTWTLDSGKRVWGYAQQPLMLQDFNKQTEKRILVSSQQNKNGAQTPSGLLQEIRDYGQYMPLLDLSNFESKFQTMAENLRLYGASKTGEYLVLTGTVSLGLVQNSVFKQYITYTGSESNLKLNGEEFVGINAVVYAYAGLTFKFVNYALLDDPYTFPFISSITGKLQASSTFIFLDTTPVKTVDGEASAFQKVIFGEEGTPEYGSYIIKGLIGQGVKGEQLGDVGRDFAPTSNASDGVSFGIWRDAGVFFPNSKAFGLMELAA